MSKAQSRSSHEVKARRRVLTGRHQPEPAPLNIGGVPDHSEQSTRSDDGSTNRRPRTAASRPEHFSSSVPRCPTEESTVTSPEPRPRWRLGPRILLRLDEHVNGHACHRRRPAPDPEMLVPRGQAFAEAVSLSRLRQVFLGACGAVACMAPAVAVYCGALMLAPEPRPCPAPWPWRSAAPARTPAARRAASRTARCCCGR